MPRAQIPGIIKVICKKIWTIINANLPATVIGGLFVAYIVAHNFNSNSQNNVNNGHSDTSKSVDNSSGTRTYEPPPAPSSIISHEPQQVDDSSITGTAEPAYIVDLTLKHSSPDIAVNKNVELGGKTMPYSIRHSCSLFCHENTGIAKFELNRKYGTFTAEIGVKQPNQTGTFIVIGDGIELKRYDVTYGNPQPIEIEIAGIQLLELHTAVAGALGGSPADMVRQGANAAGGAGNILPDLVWGSPRVLPAK